MDEQFLWNDNGDDAGQGGTAEQQAYHLVKSRIMAMHYRPGQHILETELTGELGISRTPIANALRRLEYEGLVTNQPRRGVCVTGLSLDDIHEIFNIKEALETMISRQAAASTDESLRRALREGLQEMQQWCDAGDIEAWDVAHMRWHRIVLAMSEYPNGRVPRILNNLNDQWRRVRRSLLAIEGRVDREMVEHAIIAESILARDVEQAGAHTLRHLRQVRNEVVSVLTKMVLPFATNGV